MFEFDSRKETIVVSSESITHAARIADEAIAEKAYPDTETLLSLTALAGLAAREQRLQMHISVDDTEFLHEYAGQIIEEHQERDYTLKERIRHALTGRFVVAHSVHEGTGAALAAAEKQEQHVAAVEPAPSNGNGAVEGTTSFIDELDSLDPITIAVASRQEKLDKQGALGQYGDAAEISAGRVY